MLNVTPPVKVADDRGCEVVLFDEMGEPWSSDPAEAEARDAAVDAAEAHQWSRALSRGEVVFGLFAGLAPLGLLICWKFLVGTSSVLPAFAFFGSGFAFAALNRRAKRGAIGKRMVESMVAAQRCASCGYSLVELPREEDGCTVCSACGAAWKVLES